MKRFIIIISLFVFLHGYDLEVTVDNLRNSNGNILFSLYSKEGSLPDAEFKNFYKQHTEIITKNSSKTTFYNLSKKIYAVNVLHDENKNNKIDKGILLPTEGVGLSNFKKINLFNSPNFKKASFLLDKDRKVNISIIYF